MNAVEEPLFAKYVNQEFLETPNLQKWNKT
jgi:hypothetical protein